MSALGARRLEALAVAVATAALLAMAVVRLDTYPAPWFDEGWYLQVPRNLVQYGEYATRSADAFRHDDTVLVVSSTLYLPIALVFKGAGVGLIQARLVAVAYLLLAVACCYLLARRMHGAAVGGLAAYLFLLQMEGDPFTSTWVLGRQVMGEVPAMAFVLAGCLVWRRAVSASRMSLAAVAGVLLGLSTVTKLQFVLLVPTAVALVGAAAWWTGRRREAWLAAIAAVACVTTLATWFVCLWAILGTAEASQLAANISAASAPQVRVSSTAAAVRAISFLLGSTFLVTGLPALIYAMLLERWQLAPDPGRRLVIALTVVMLGWFAFRSVGWPRYAYPGLALTSLLTAKLLVDLAEALGAAVARGAASAAEAVRRRRAAVALVVVLALALPLANLRPVLKALAGPQDRSFQELTAWIDRSVAPGTLIETWELEVAAADSQRSYHIPPVRLVSEAIARVNLGTQGEPIDYDARTGGAELLVLGKFAKWTQLYPSDLVESATKVVSFGEYDVYRLASGSGAGH